MSALNVVVTTPAGGGDISPAPAGPAYLQEVSSIAGAAGVVEPPEPGEIPAEAGSDEITIDEVFDFDLEPVPDDDSDPAAFPRSRRRIVCSVSSDGQTTIHRFGVGGIVLTAAETRDLYEFLMSTLTIWRTKC